MNTNVRKLSNAIFLGQKAVVSIPLTPRVKRSIINNLVKDPDELIGAMSMPYMYVSNLNLKTDYDDSFVDEIMDLAYVAHVEKFGLRKISKIFYKGGTKRHMDLFVKNYIKEIDYYTGRKQYRINPFSYYPIDARSKNLSLTHVEMVINHCLKIAALSKTKSINLEVVAFTFSKSLRLVNEMNHISENEKALFLKKYSWFRRSFQRKGFQNGAERYLNSLNNPL